MFKKSVYNVKIKELDNNRYLFYNTCSGALAQFDEFTNKIYENIENINIKECDKNGIETISTLQENGFITDINTDERAIFKAVSKIKRYSSNILNLTMAPTTMCNMKCSYCFEKIEKTKIDKKIINAIINFVHNQIKSKKIKVVSVTWFGGEPLLEINIIKKISKALLEICDKYRIDYEAKIITNGILLTEEIAKLLVQECKVFDAQITIDGLSNTHNSRRRYELGNGFEIIMNNILRCKRIINIQIRINIDSNNIDETYKLIDYLAEQDNLKDEVYVYIAKVEGDFDNCFTSKQYSKYHIDLLDYLKKKKFYYSINRTFPNPSAVSCGSITNNSFVIDSLGNIYTCLSQIGCVEKRIGDIFNGVDINNNYSKWLNVECNDQCNKCSFLPICNGGCPLNTIEGKPFSCTFNNEQYLKIISNYYEINSGEYEHD